MGKNNSESNTSSNLSAENSAEKSPAKGASRITQPENVFLILLLSADLFFIIFHVLSAYNLLPKFLPFGNKLVPTSKEMFSLSRDRGFPEIFQYIQYFWIFLLLLLASFQNRNWRYLAWSPLFLFLLIDDYGRVHENIGAKLAVQYNLPPLLGLHPKHTGELIVAAVMGLILLILLTFAIASGNRQFRHFSLVVGLILVGYAICGLGFDAVNNIIGENVQMNIFGIFEDGGEMVTISLLSWWTFIYATKYFQEDVRRTR